ncbi:MAG: TerC/Alx family metal homeostasis membrane protein [Arsenophonus sp.]|nr:MAG: TerC/Alx family metal homeostasis membrane protein [Arsenophonus sp.]
MYSIGTPILWTIFLILILVMFLFDVITQRKFKIKYISLKYCLIWTIIWIFITFCFILGIWIYIKENLNILIANQTIILFITSYLLEKTLAIDNLFVWIVLFDYFSISISLQRKVLTYGILGAVFLRIFLIFLGDWLILHFSWILYVFGILLIFSGIKILFLNKKTIKIQETFLFQSITKYVSISDKSETKKFFIKKNGKFFITPLLVVLILVELSDIFFALDSIPAIFSITQDPFIVSSTNIFALLGLRSMYFLLLKIIKKFYMIKYALSIIIILIGFKMVIVDFIHISAIFCLISIIFIFSIAIIINYIVNNCKKLK